MREALVAGAFLTLAAASGALVCITLQGLLGVYVGFLVSIPISLSIGWGLGKLMAEVI